jgi:hypothetical protein
LTNLNIYTFKYNKSKIKVTLEEEKTGRRQDRGANKEEHMNHPCVISSPLQLDGVFRNPHWVIYIFQ